MYASVDPTPPPNEYLGTSHEMTAGSTWWVAVASVKWLAASGPVCPRWKRRWGRQGAGRSSFSLVLLPNIRGKGPRFPPVCTAEPGVRRPRNTQTDTNHFVCTCMCVYRLRIVEAAD